MIERVALSQGGRVTSVDPATNTIVTDFGNYTAQVANVIPPQKAGRIAEIAGAADNTGWCPIDPVTFASKLVPNIHVIGDAAIAGGIPKSASAAHAQGKACAAAVVNMLSGKAPETPRLTGACYSTVAPDYAFSLSGIYQPKDGQFAEVEARDAARSMRRARFARARRKMRKTGSGRSRWRPLARSTIQHAGLCLAAALLALACPAGAQAPAAVYRRRRCHSGIADDMRAATRRAAARWWSSAAALASSATTARFPSRGSRAIWPRPCGHRQPLVRGPIAAAAGRCRPPQCRDHHAVLLSGRRPDPRRPGLARQADAVGRTDRGYRGVSGDAARIGSDDARRNGFNSPPVPRPRRRRGVLGAVPIVTLRPAEATPAMLASAIRNVTAAPR